MYYIPLTLVLLTILLPWFVAEFQGGRAIRIGLGFAAIFATAAVVHVVATVVPSYERQLHRASMKKLGELAARGEVSRVQQALSVYNTSIEANGSTHSAAMKMWKVVSASDTPPGAE